MSDQTTTPVGEQPQSSRPVVTLPIIKAKFNSELTKHRYQEALDRFSSLSVTMENTAQVQETMKKVRGFIKTIGDIKDEGKRPSLEEGRMWDRAYKDIIDPLNQILVSKTNELQKMIDKIAEENRKKEQERQRVEGIKKAIDDFFLTTSQVIANTQSAEGITVVEKLIGSHKANKTRYQEFLPDLIARAGELAPLIKKQKEHIKELAEIERKKKEAEATGDDRTLLELQEKEELINHSLNESKINVQEEAIRQATAPDAVTSLVATSTAIKYRRQSWKYEVLDAKELYKKMPHLIELTPNDEKIKELLASKKAEGATNDVEEIKLPGLRFYLEKLA